MKRALFILPSLLLISLLAGCGGNSSTTSSSVGEASSSEAPSLNTSSSGKTQDDYFKDLNKVHTFASFSMNIKVVKGEEQIASLYNKKWIDVTNKIERLLLTSKTIQSLEDGNTSTININQEIYKSENYTYTNGEDGKYKVTEGSDAVFSVYKIDFDFAKLANITFNVVSFNGEISGDVSDITGFSKGTSFTDASNMKVKGAVDSLGQLVRLDINYTYKSEYTVTSSYLPSYSSFTLQLPS